MELLKSVMEPFSVTNDKPFLLVGLAPGRPFNVGHNVRGMLACLCFPSPKFQNSQILDGENSLLLDACP